MAGRGSSRSHLTSRGAASRPALQNSWLPHEPTTMRRYTALHAREHSALDRWAGGGPCRRGVRRTGRGTGDLASHPGGGRSALLPGLDIGGELQAIRRLSQAGGTAFFHAGNPTSLAYQQVISGYVSNGKPACPP